MMLDYIFLWNAIHYPAGSCPVTRVKAGEEAYSDEHNDGWSSALQRSAKGSAGMPISV